MRTVCVDGPRSGEIVTATGDSFRVPIPAKLSATIGAPEPLAPAPEYLTYRRMELPYDTLPQTPIGSVDHSRLSLGDSTLVSLLSNKAQWNIGRRSWEFWSCARV